MGRKRIIPKKTDPTLLWEDGFWWLVTGSKKENVGRSRRYAENVLAQRQAK